MSYNRKHYKGAKPDSKASASDTPEKQNGFAGLKPSQMGLDLPDWLTESPVVPSSEIVPRPDAETSVEMESQTRSLLEGMKPVCICKGIKKRMFWRAMDEGARTKEEINRATGSGTGSCQGRRCGPRILEMLRHRAP